MKITDEMLFEHAAEARDIWLSTLPADEDIPEIPTSKTFEKKMQKLIKKQRCTPKTNKILRYMKQTVAAVVAVAILSFGGLITVEAYREKVIEIAVHVFHELTDYRFASDSSEAKDIILPDVSFEFIPEGIDEVENRIAENNRRLIIYEDNHGKFFEFTQRVVGSDGEYNTILDTEDSDYEATMINGNEAYYNVKDGDCSIFWTENSIVYNLFGNLDKNELIEIAAKIKISEK